MIFEFWFLSFFLSFFLFCAFVLFLFMLWSLRALLVYDFSVCAFCWFLFFCLCFVCLCVCGFVFVIVPLVLNLVGLSVCGFVCLWVCLFAILSVCDFVCLWFCLFVILSVYAFDLHEMLSQLEWRRYECQACRTEQTSSSLELGS